MLGDSNTETPVSSGQLVVLVQHGPGCRTLAKQTRRRSISLSFPGTSCSGDNDGLPGL